MAQQHPALTPGRKGNQKTDQQQRKSRCTQSRKGKHPTEFPVGVSIVAVYRIDYSNQAQRPTAHIDRQQQVAGDMVEPVEINAIHTFFVPTGNAEVNRAQHTQNGAEYRTDQNLNPIKLPHIQGRHSGLVLIVYRHIGIQPCNQFKPNPFRSIDLSYIKRYAIWKIIFVPVANHIVTAYLPTQIGMPGIQCLVQCFQPPLIIGIQSPQLRQPEQLIDFIQIPFKVCMNSIPVQRIIVLPQNIEVSNLIDRRRSGSGKKYQRQQENQYFQQKILFDFHITSSPFYSPDPTPL